MASRDRKRQRIDRAIAAHRPPPTVTLVGSPVEMTPAIAALVAELIALGRTGAA